MPARPISLAVAMTASLTLVPAAGAHNISLSPRSGDINTLYQFRGTAWQPRKKVTWNYFATTGSTVPLRTGTVTTKGGGGFLLGWRDSLVGKDFGITHRLCFRQLDTRFGRTFQRCAQFWVGPPSAQWTPSSSNPGDVLVLLVSGFLPGRTLQVSTTGPTGASTGSPFTLTTATSGGFQTPSAPFGPIFVPRGGGVYAFTAGSAGPGLYTSLVLDPPSGMKAYASELLLR